MDLRGADLSCADLRWADLNDAKLQDTDLRGANLSDVQKLPELSPNQIWHDEPWLRVESIEVSPNRKWCLGAVSELSSRACWSVAQLWQL